MRVYRDQYDRHSGRRKSPRDNYRRDDKRKQMHDAVCDECGEDCQVPFRPSGDKPIYCSKCFEKHDDGGRSRDRRPRNNGSNNLEEKILTLESKVDRILKILENQTLENVPEPVEEVKDIETEEQLLSDE